jgi:WD40 repeat protein
VPAHEGEVFSLDFSPDGGRLVSGGYDHAIRLWEVSTGSLLREIDGHRGWVTSVAFSQDGTRVLSASEDGTVGLWEAASGARLEHLVGHGAVSVARSLASGRYVIYAGSGHRIHIFDTREHEEMEGIDLSGAGDTVSSLALCPDETCFVVGTQAGAVLKFELDL